MNKILIVEDEVNISSLIKIHLEREGYECLQAFDGDTAVELFHKSRPDLVLLDLMLPGKNGLEVCREIRAKYSTYILMLTAKQEEIDKILGLEMGADDYMIKPFSIRELLARVRALLRRPQLMNDPNTGLSQGEPPLVIGNIEIRPEEMLVKLDGQRVLVTALEFELLHFLMKNRGIVFKREQLLERIWGDDSEVYDRSIDHLISQLRKKIEKDPASPKKIVTVWGVGYKYDANT